MVNQTSVTIAQAPSPLFFTQVSAGPGDSKLQFRLIHFWEARKHAKGGILIGIEMLMIDEQGTVAQWFIAQNRVTAQAWKHLHFDKLLCIQQQGDVRCG